MTMDKRALHQLIDQLPDVKTDEAAKLLIALLRHDETAISAEDRAWLDAGANDVARALAEAEDEIPPEDLQAWLAAFESLAQPCTYVPGRGFVPLP
jgi:hypothetical protein